MSTIDDIAGSDLGLKFISDRRANDQKLKSRFEHIFQKYERDFTNIGDEIDLTTGQVIINNGHLESMQNEIDTGQVVTSSFIDDSESGDEAGTQDDTPDLEEDDDDDESDFERSLHDLGIQIDGLSEGGSDYDDETELSEVADPIAALTGKTKEKRPVPVKHQTHESNDHDQSQNDASQIRILDKLPSILKSSVLAMKPDGVEMNSESLQKLESNITSQIAQYLANSGSANVSHKESTTTKEAAWQYPDLPELPPLKRQKLMSPAPARLALPSSAALFTRSPTSRRSLWAPSKQKKFREPQLSENEEVFESEQDSEGDLPVLGNRIYDGKTKPYSSARGSRSIVPTPAAPRKMAYAANTARRMTNKTDQNQNSSMSHLDFLNRYYPTERQHEREMALASRHLSKLQASTDRADALTLKIIQELGSDGETLNSVQREFIRTIALQSQQIAEHVPPKPWKPQEDVQLYKLKHLQGKSLSDLVTIFPDRSKGSMAARVKYISRVIIPEIEKESKRRASAMKQGKQWKERALWKDMEDAVIAKQAFLEMMAKTPEAEIALRSTRKNTPENEDELSLFIPENETPSDRQGSAVLDERAGTTTEPQPYAFTVQDDRLIKRLRERSRMMFDQIAKNFPQSNAAEIADRYLNRLHGKIIPKDLPPMARIPTDPASPTAQSRKQSTNHRAEALHGTTTTDDQSVERDEQQLAGFSPINNRIRSVLPYGPLSSKQNVENEVLPNTSERPLLEPPKTATTETSHHPNTARPAQNAQLSQLSHLLPNMPEKPRPPVARQRAGSRSTTDLMFSFRSDALIQSGARRPKPPLPHKSAASVVPSLPLKQRLEQSNIPYVAVADQNHVILLDTAEPEELPAPIEMNNNVQHTEQDGSQTGTGERQAKRLNGSLLPEHYDDTSSVRDDLPACMTPPRRPSPQLASSPPMPTTVYGTPNKWKQTAAPYFGASNGAVTQAKDLKTTQTTSQLADLTQLPTNIAFTNKPLTTSRHFCPRMHSLKTPEKKQGLETHSIIGAQTEAVSYFPGDYSQYDQYDNTITVVEDDVQAISAGSIAPELQQTESTLVELNDYHDPYLGANNSHAVRPAIDNPALSQSSSDDASQASKQSLGQYDARQALSQIRSTARKNTSTRPNPRRRVVPDSDDSESDYAVEARTKIHAKTSVRQTYTNDIQKTKRAAKTAKSRRPKILHKIGSSGDDSGSDFTPEDERVEVSADEQEVFVEESVRMPNGKMIHLKGYTPTEVEDIEPELEPEPEPAQRSSIGDRELYALLQPRFHYAKGNTPSMKVARALTSSKTKHNSRQSLPAASARKMPDVASKSRISQLRSESKPPSRRHSSPALRQGHTIRRDSSKQSSRSSVVGDPSLTSSKHYVDQLSEDELA